jgi:hypothetical protein
MTNEATGLKGKHQAATAERSSPEVKVNGQPAVNQSENPARYGVHD